MAEFPIRKGDGCQFGDAGQKIGFLGATPVVKPTVNALSVSVGTGDGTVADVGGAFNQTTLNNNFRDVADKINEIRTALVNYGLL